MASNWHPRVIDGGRPGGSPRLFASLAGAVALVLSWQALARPPAAGPGGTISVEDVWAVRVIDGDTFDYRGQRIRVADIDTPETRSPRCAAEAELGARATRRMAGLLAGGPFTLEPGGDGRDEDVYGRKLRIVSRGGRSLGATLVAEGLAHEWRGSKLSWCTG